MHIISRKPFNDAARKYPNDRGALMQTYTTLRSGTFTTPAELRKIFPSLDNFKYRDKWWVIDIGGHNLRMIAFIEFRDNRMYVKHVVSHAEHDKLTDKYRQTKES
ncbi:MAG: type II toxin-antitoxin system HigB family toxin [Nitrincola lacisaponensis]|uniref:type II toxin-antitoxin system HigB family toxin n=1 Tax=Nitrincola lacisaponensis TaxID=267850 RepID=UPI00391CD129